MTGVGGRLRSLILARMRVVLVYALLAASVPCAPAGAAQERVNPVAGDGGFLVVVAGGATLNSGSDEGGLAVGGDLSPGGPYSLAAGPAAGTPSALPAPTGPAGSGLLVGGSVHWPAGTEASGLTVGSGAVTIGDPDGSVALRSPSGATEIEPAAREYGPGPHPGLRERPQALSAQSGPVPVNFTAAFDAFRARSAAMAHCDNTVGLTDAQGRALPAIAPAGTKAYLATTPGAVNVLDISATALAHLSSVTFEHAPDSDGPLIVNVDTSGVGDDFTWTPPSMAGLSEADARFILFNFATAKQVTVTGPSPVTGTVYAPTASIDERSGAEVDGSVIAGAFTQGESGGEAAASRIRDYPFAAAIGVCASPPAEPSAGAAGQAAATSPPTSTGAPAAPLMTDPVRVVPAGSGTAPAPSAGATPNASPTAAPAHPAVTRRPRTGIQPRATPGLTITKTSNVSTVTFGGTVIYTITATNSGSTSYTGATFTDSLTGVLDDAVYNNNAATNTGTLSYTAPNLTWTGNLAIGATAVIAYSVTVDNPDGGDKVLTDTVSSSTPGSNCPTGGYLGFLISGSYGPALGNGQIHYFDGTVQNYSLNAPDWDATSGTNGVAVAVNSAYQNKPGNTTNAHTADIFAEPVALYPGKVLTSVVLPALGTLTVGTAALHVFAIGGVSASSLASAYNDVGITNDTATAPGNYDGNGNSFSETALTNAGAAPGASITSSGVTYTFPNVAAGTNDNVVANGQTITLTGSTAACAVTDTVTVPGLTIAKTSNVSTVAPGGTVNYTITATNSGATAYTGATFSDSLTGVLTNAVYNNNAAASTGTVAYTSPNLTWTGNLAVGAVATITYSVTVDNPDPGNKLLTDVISSSTPGSNCPNGSNLLGFLVSGSYGPATGTGTITYTDGTTQGYTLTSPDWLSNSPPAGGALAVSPVYQNRPGNVTYAQSAYIFSESVALTQGKTLASLVLPTLGTLATGTPALHVFAIGGVSASSLASAYNDVGITNDTATAPGNYDGNGSSFSEQALTQAGAAPGATLTSSGVSFTFPNVAAGTNDNVVANGQTITLTGPAAQCAVTDTVTAPGLTIAKTSNVSTVTPGGTVLYTITATNSGTTAYTGATFSDSLTGVLDDATYNSNAAATTGTVSYTSPNLTWTGNLAVGAVATITYSVTVNNPDTGDKILTDAISSSTPGSNCPSGSNLLGFLMSASNGPVSGSGTINYTDGTTQTYTLTAPDWFTTSPPAGVAVAVNSLYQQRNGVTGYPYNAEVFSVAIALKPGKTLSSVILPAVGTLSSSTAALHIFAVGGVSASSLATSFNDIGISNDSAPTVGSFDGYPGDTYSEQALTAAGAGPGAVFTSSGVSFTFPNVAAGTNDNVVANGQTITLTGPTAQCAVTDTVLVPALTIAKTANVSTITPGGTVNYTITVTNSGQTAYTGAAFSDSLSGVLDDAVYNNNAVASTGTVAYTSPNLTWTGNLAVGAVATITYSATVNNPDTGDKALINTITSSTPGNTCPTGNSNPSCTVNVTVLVPALTISKTANVSTVLQGGTVNYTITVTNSGQTVYTGAAFSDSLSGVLDDAVYNNNAVATAGTVAYTTPNLTWTGNLAVGAVATITYSVTVNNPDTGDKLLANTITSSTVGNNCPTGNANPSCAANVTVLVPGLTIAKTANMSTTTPGSTVQYTITVTNSGQTVYTGAAFSDSLSGVLDDAVYNNNAVATTGTVAYTSPNLTWTGNLAVGAVATITYSATVNNPDTGDKALINTITSSTTGNNCPAAGSDPRCASNITVLIPGLTIAKTANVSTTTPGSTVQYTITVTNSGQTVYTGAAFSDSLSGVLDDAVYNNNAVATTGTVAYTSPNLTWTGNLAVGAVATITYSATVNNPDTGNKILTNAVTSSTVGNTCPTGNTNAACTVSVTVLVPGLTIAKTANVSTTTPGSTVQYTITVTDSGQTAYTGAAFSDSLSGMLGDAVYNNNAVATTGTVVYTSPNLTWTGNLAVGAVATITYSVTVNNPDTGGKILTNAVTSSTVGNTCPTGNANPACTVSVTVLVPGLTIVKTATVSSTTPGSVVHYTITVTDSGQTAYTGAALSDSLAGVLDDATFNSDATATTGTLAYMSPNLTWTGNLAVGAVATITYSVTVNNPDTGDKALINTITSGTVGNNCPAAGTDPRCTSNVTVLIPGLTIAKTANASTTVPSSVVQYTITVTDSGQTPYTGATFTDPLTGTLGDAAYNNNATATTGTVAYTSPNITWTGNLAVGAVATITYSVTVNNPDTGGKVITDTVTSTTPGNNCPTSSTDSRCNVTVTVLTPGLTIVKTANASSIVQGGTVVYTITVTNSGQIPYTGAAFSDSLSGVLGDAVYNNNATTTAGTVAYTSPVLTWTGNLAPTASATITYSVTVNNPDTGSKSMVNTVTSSTTGNNCPSGGTDSRCTNTVTVTTAMPLTIVKTSDVSSVAPGGTVHYTVTVTNSGTTTSTGAAFSDSLTGVLGDSAYNNNATASAGTVAYTSPILTWTGNLAAGAAATITYSVTVNSPDTGGGTLTNTATSTTPGNNCPASGTDPRCTSTVTVSQLVINNMSSSQTTTPGSIVRFTLTAANTGKTAYQGITLFTTAADVFDDATPNGDQTANFGSIVVTSSGVTWTGNIPVGATLTITGTVTVKNPDTGNKLLASTVSTTAQGSNCPSGSTDPRCTVDVTVLIPGLTIAKTANVSTTTPGSTVQYTITVTNSGQTAYTGAALSDSFSGMLDDAVYNNNATATTGTIAYTSPNLTWSGNLAVGAVATITYSVTVNNPDTGDKDMINTVISSTVGNNCPSGGTDSRCSVAITVLVPGLTIVKTANVSTVVQGGTVQYTIKVTDSGQTPYTGAALLDSLAGVLDDATYNNDATTTVGAVTYTAPNLTWTGNLALGASATITYSVIVNNPDTGDKNLINTVTSSTPGNNCPSGGTDARCTNTVVTTFPYITLTNLTPNFTLTGLPNTTPEMNNAVTMTVATNSVTGYTVTAQAAGAALVPNLSTNPNSIPIGDLKAREHGTSAFTPLSASSAVVLHSQHTASAAGGDAIGNDYELAIPVVESGTYSVTITYIAMTM